MRYSIDGHCPKTSTERFFIAPSADLIGDIHIGDNVSIWFQCMIRADMDRVSVGDNSNLQDACVIHVDKGYPVSIGRGVTVGHKVMLHGCEIGDNSLIGMNATLLNGVKIGDNCIIGAGTLLTENTVIPDNTLVFGSPGKVVKQTSAEQQALIRQSAIHYVENALRYRQSLNKLD